MNSLSALLRIPSLRRRTAVTALLMAAAFGIMHIPVPGVDHVAVDWCQDSEVGGALSVANFLGGGALAKLTFGAVGVMPFITASIILILAGRISRPVAAMTATRGRKYKVTVAVMTTLMVAGQAAGTAVTAQRGNGLLKDCPFPLLPGPLWHAGVAAACIMAGTAALLALGALVTKYGLGNGISFIIAMGVLGVLPTELVRVAAHGGAGLAVIAVSLLTVVVAGLVWLNGRTVSLPVTLGWREESDPTRKRSLPIPLNPAGVMPLILASTLVNGPMVLDMLVPGEGWPRRLSNLLSAPSSPWHMVTLALATVALIFYWTIVTWDAEQMAAGLHQNAISVDGTTDQASAAARIDATLLRATLLSAPLLAALAVMPSLAVALLGTTARFPLGGSTLLVIVAIGADTLKRIKADIDAATSPEQDASDDDLDRPTALPVSDEELDVALVGLGRFTHRLV